MNKLFLAGSFLPGLTKAHLGSGSFGVRHMGFGAGGGVLMSLLLIVWLGVGVLTLVWLWRQLMKK